MLAAIVLPDGCGYEGKLLKKINVTLTGIRTWALTRSNICAMKTWLNLGESLMCMV